MEISCNKRICAKNKINKNGIGIKIDYGKNSVEYENDMDSYNINLSNNSCKISK